MKKRLLFVIVLVLTNCASSQNGTISCALHVDLRWRKDPKAMLRAPTGEVASDDITGTVMNAAGKAYWEETSRKKYTDVCLNAEHPDYYVVWTWNQTPYSAQLVMADVYAPGESGCLMFPPLFEVSKVTKDQERATRQAFRQVLDFLAKAGKGNVPQSSHGCIPADDWALPNPLLQKANSLNN